MGNAPRDYAFNRAIAADLDKPPPEYLLFYNTSNQVIEAIYPVQFEPAQVRKIRMRLEQEGDLKAIVHAFIPLIGDRQGHGPRLTIVEMVSDHKFYMKYSPGDQALWIKPDKYPEELAYAQNLWGNGEEEQ